MPQNITTSAKSLVEAAEREIENLSVEDAIKLHGRDDVVLVDIRDPRELPARRQGSGRVPLPARHAGVLDRSGERFHKPKFAEDKRFVFLLRRGLRSALGRTGGTTHGAEAGRHIPRRLRRLEERRWTGRSAGAPKPKA
jgi:rhodanese-related sulfurtransferase